MKASPPCSIFHRAISLRPHSRWLCSHVDATESSSPSSEAEAKTTKKPLRFVRISEYRKDTPYPSSEETLDPEELKSKDFVDDSKNFALRIQRTISPHGSVNYTMSQLQKRKPPAGEVEYSFPPGTFVGPFTKDGRRLDWLDYRIEVLNQTMMTRKESKVFTGLEVVVEIRDARIPRLSTHPDFTKWCTKFDCPRMILYSRSDIMSKEHIAAIRNWTHESYDVIPPTHVYFEDMRGDPSMKPTKHNPEMKDIMRIIWDLIRFRRHRRAAMKYALVVGMPGSGKTTFVKTAIRHKRKHNGLTIHPGFKAYWAISRPNIKLVDTWSVFPPQSVMETDAESLYKLIVCGSFRIEAARKFGVTDREIADYLLFKLNQKNCLDYVSHFGLSGPITNVDEFLSALSDSASVDQRTEIFLGAFNEGKLGSIILDDLSELDKSMDEEIPTQIPQFRYGYNIPTWARYREPLL